MKITNKHNVINSIYVEPIMKTIIYNYISFIYWKNGHRKCLPNFNKFSLETICC